MILEMKLPTIVGERTYPMTEAVADQLNPHGGHGLPNRGISDLAIRIWGELVDAARRKRLRPGSRQHRDIAMNGQYESAVRVLAQTYGKTATFYEIEAFKVVDET